MFFLHSFVEIDHFHNAASFVEMPKKVIENYVKYIKKFKTKEISLISQRTSANVSTRLSFSLIIRLIMNALFPKHHIFI